MPDRQVSIPPVCMRETWPHESCFECRLRMPSDDHADAHYRMTGHAMGWPLDADEMRWPVATDAQTTSANGSSEN